MEKFYYSLILAFLLSLPLQAQKFVVCGDSGITFTFNKMDFTSPRRGSSRCEISYDITVTATQVGEYKIKAVGVTILNFTVTDPGIVQFEGEGAVNLPCFLLTTVLPDLVIETPSGSCILDISALLPVKLIAFTATEENGSAMLRWATASEVNNEGFFVEHTKNGDDWDQMGFVAGVGTTNELQNYDFQIDGLPEGQHYFRLRQVDYDGVFEYSPIASLYLENPANRLQIFPNPVGRGQQLNIQGSFDQIKIYNAAGQLVHRLPASDNYSNPQMLDLPSGFYQMLIQRGGEVIKERLIIQ